MSKPNKPTSPKRPFNSEETASSNKKIKTNTGASTYYSAPAFQASSSATSSSTTATTDIASNITLTVPDNTNFGPTVTSAPPSPMHATENSDDDDYIVEGTFPDDTAETQAEAAELVMKSTFGGIFSDYLETIDLIEPNRFTIEVNVENLTEVRGKQDPFISFSLTAIEKLKSLKPGNKTPVFSISHSQLQKSAVQSFFSNKGFNIDGVTVSDKCTTVWVPSVEKACQISALNWQIISDVPVRFVLASGDRAAIPKLRIRCKQYFTTKIFTRMINNMLRKAGLPDCSLVEMWRTKKGQYRGSATVYLLHWQADKVALAIKAIDGKGPKASTCRAEMYGQ